ncbi:MAG: AMP-binding protein [Betaproteobacteria bacterium]|nr:AMP-binding protein [Betaproteobacteria bacterium]
MRAVVRFCVRLSCGVRVLGEPAPLFGRRVILLANHPGISDAVLLGMCLPVSPVVLFPREELRHGVVRWFSRMRLFEGHAWDMSDPMTIKRAMRLLEAGRPVAVFPEGRIERAANVMKIYEGAALLAMKSGATLVPVHIERPSRSRGLRTKVRIHIQAPTHLDPSPAAGPRARREAGSRELARIMRNAAFQSHVPEGLFDRFLDAVAREGRRTEIIEDANERPGTYGSLLKASLALSRWIRRHTRESESVGLLLPNMIASVNMLLALQCSGRVAAMLNYTSGVQGVRAAQATACLRTVVTSRAFVDQAGLQPLIDALDGVRVLYLEDVRREFGPWDRVWLFGFAIWWPRLVRARVGPHDTAAILFTSGSEGQPKGVALSHAGLQANIRQIATVLDFTPADKVLNALPMYHAYSFAAGVWLCLLTGVKLFLYVSPLRYRAIPEIAYRRDATYLFGTSTFLGFYARHAHAGDFGTLRYVISGGEKLGEDVTRLWLEKFGLRILEGYGATECTVISLSTPLGFRSGCVGRLLPGLEARLEPVHGIEKGGVLHVRGAAVMLGYITEDMPGIVQPVSSAFGEGWYRTGDVVDVDAEGFLRIVGRVRRFAKIAGEMVSLDQVERVAAAASPECAHAAVLKLEASGGETTVLFTTDRVLDRRRLAQAARGLGAQDLAVARNIIRLPEIPLLGNGKTDYVRLMDMVSDTAFWSLRVAEGESGRGGDAEGS